MLPASADAILARLEPTDVVLDIGGWGRPFNRADWVMDAMPYESRGLYGSDGPGEERFSADTWIERDICAREPYPFEDGAIDFVVCSHTLEDVRDPLWVCSEMIRIARAGYIEVPSRLEEQSYGFQGPWVGWGHHRWLIDIGDGRIDFVFKHHVIHGRATDHFPAGFRDALPPKARVQTLWWDGPFGYRERIFVSAEELDRYVAEFVARNRDLVQLDGGERSLLGVLRRSAGRLAGARDRERP
jgi:SAM-dependent methyltransferase